MQNEKKFLWFPVTHSITVRFKASLLILIEKLNLKKLLILIGKPN